MVTKYLKSSVKDLQRTGQSVTDVGKVDGKSTRARAQGGISTTTAGNNLE